MAGINSPALVPPQAAEQEGRKCKTPESNVHCRRAKLRQPIGSECLLDITHVLSAGLDRSLRDTRTNRSDPGPRPRGLTVYLGANKYYLILA